MLIVKCGIYAVICIICFLVFLLCIQKREKRLIKSRVSLFFKNSNIRLFNYEETEMMLQKNGITDAYPFINPFNYQICRLIFGCILFVLAYLILYRLDFAHPMVSLVLIPIGFLLLDYVVKWMNDRENARMMPDIRKIYDSLKIQSKAGMYLTESLMEIYRVVSNKRLKKALLELNGFLFVKNQIIDGIHMFQTHFNNEYIDMLCVTIEQAEKSGQSARILNDISRQLVTVQKQLHIQEEESMKTKVMIVQLLLLITVMVIIVILLSTILSGAAL